MHVTGVFHDGRMHVLVNMHASGGGGGGGEGGRGNMHITFSCRVVTN